VFDRQRKLLQKEFMRSKKDDDIMIRRIEK